MYHNFIFVVESLYQVTNLQGVVAGLLVQNALKYLLKFGHVSPYLVSFFCCKTFR